VTTKEKAIRVIEALPENASLGEIVDHLPRLEHEGPSGGAAPPALGAGAWDILRQSAGSLKMPADWSAEHDHYLYGTPKRSSNGYTAPRTV
jgi:hypothetical protein